MLCRMLCLLRHADSLPAAAESTGKDAIGSEHTRRTQHRRSGRTGEHTSHHPALCAGYAAAVCARANAAKYYSSFEHEEKRQLEVEVHKLVTKRDPKFTNFIEFKKYKIVYRRYAGQTMHTREHAESGHTHRARNGLRIAVCSLAHCGSGSRVLCVLCVLPSGLYFSFCLDVNDNELAYLESIHLFVELLDKFFASVCELDLVFNFHKIYSILDEIYLGGEIQETSKRVILERLEELNKLE